MLYLLLVYKFFIPYYTRKQHGIFIFVLKKINKKRKYITIDNEVSILE